MTRFDHALLERARDIKLAVFDCDGVFTDGRLWMGDDGHEVKAFHVHDGLGIKLLMGVGVAVAVISGRESAAVRKRMGEIGVTHLYEGVEDKLSMLRELQAKLSIADRATAFIGDDLPDIPAMSVVGLAVTVAGAVPAMDRVAHWSTTSAGGHGAVREVCDLILTARGAS